jgi:hypothetical protein
MGTVLLATGQPSGKQVRRRSCTYACSSTGYRLPHCASVVSNLPPSARMWSEKETHFCGNKGRDVLFNEGRHKRGSFSLCGDETTLQDLLRQLKRLQPNDCTFPTNMQGTAATIHSTEPALTMPARRVRGLFD